MVHVLIERNIAQDMESTYEQLSRSTLHQAYQALGFISGETFKDLENPRRRYVMSRWRSIQDWQQWHASEPRKDMMSKLSLVLAEPEKIAYLDN